LLEAKILRDSPARSVKRLSENERQFYVLTDDEEKLYIMACPQPLQDVAIIMLETGMRCGEVYRIRRSEVFLNKGYLKVTKGKTKAAIRQVHLTKKAQSVLSYRLNKFKGENLFPRKDIDGELPTSTLDKLHICAIEKLFFKFRLYDCRHTFATRAVENGVDLVTLASILGHASLRMVIRYAHPSETHKADAIKQMEMARINKKAKAV
ncbi:MAG: site-specific integrase, partial [Pyrinomonadaceae bacterium]|nr:site-specific integrase [Pyrinomonadaceae bacterium]